MVEDRSSISPGPDSRWAAFIASAGLHLLAASVIVTLVPRSAPTTMTTPTMANASPVDVRQLVFIARNPTVAGGGGGGGNRQTAPARHAEAIGSDPITLRVARPVSTTGGLVDRPALPTVLLDAKPLASGSVNQIGLPVGGVSFGTSTGPGSGGGVGEGTGTGIGSGSGPGIGSGIGGGIGGGVHRPGGAVTAPRVISIVKPTYTNEALSEKIQGTVVLELVVRASGQPSEIRVVQSLDPGGLDQQAIIAASQWRFAPGRLAGKPVDVVVTVMLDFSIR